MAAPRRAKRISAGIALIRRRPAGLELLVVHPGGPFWRNKDANAWSIPKGEVEATDTGPDDRGESSPRESDPGVLEAVARREFVEETGKPVPGGPLIALQPFSIGSGKQLAAFAVFGDLDADTIESNLFEMEWPPRSGRMASFPEVDRAEWVAIDVARSKLHKGQGRLVDELEPVLTESGW